jgi:hypothetical protein
MNTYYLIYSKVERREIISTYIIPGCTVLQNCEATCWIAAKKEFGYPLTDVQKLILENGYSSMFVGSYIDLKMSTDKEMENILKKEGLIDIEVEYDSI